MTSPSFARVLVAVDDTPAALAAVRVAIGVAASSGGRIRFLHVRTAGELTQALSLTELASGPEKGGGPEEDALLRRVLAEAEKAGVPAEAESLDGRPAAVVLAQARDWAADLVVLGRSDVRGPGLPYVGTVTRDVLELSDRPVLVVPGQP
jgi:nucleotide-binding universal stress UspA family protein